MLTITTLASGSSGNSLLVSGGDTHILIDAGISCRRITTALNQLDVDPNTLAAVLVTHAHTDHVCGLATMVKKLSAPIYASTGTAHQLTTRMGLPSDRISTFAAGDAFDIGPLHCTSFPTPHDSADSVGYTVELDGCRLALATDLGHVTDTVRRAVLGCQTVVLESNHDIDWLRSGPYPYPLKQRILGDRGHLCNEAGADLALQAAQAGANTIILAHLSNENNTPARAYDVTFRHLCANGIDPERDIRLSVAPRSQPGPTYPVVKEVPVC
ncbi:MAG: MBL fold metallo-hydrolase [Oscillospiraceae bacterium]|nr:MBL fold metallo-hydrolase [Oscillospiraceae bacterium]